MVFVYAGASLDSAIHMVAISNQFGRDDATHVFMAKHHHIHVPFDQLWFLYKYAAPLSVLLLLWEHSIPLADVDGIQITYRTESTLVRLVHRRSSVGRLQAQGS